MLAAPSDHKALAAIERLTGKPIEREEMQGLEGIASSPDERHAGRERDRDRRGRGRHGERRSHPPAPHGEVAAREPVDQSRAVEQPRTAEVPAELAPREHKPREHKPREQKQRHSEKPKRHDHPPQPAPQVAAQAKAKPEPRKHDEAKGGDSKVGMGDHTPAFLLKPVPKHLLRSKKETEAA